MQLLFTGIHNQKIEASINALRHYQPKEGEYFGCFSGGKDSVAIKRLAEIAEVPVTWHYHVTTLDPPEQVAFIKRSHPDVVRDKPKRTFLDWILSKGLPTRTTRWCCEKLKEGVAPRPSTLIMGIRWAESRRRSREWKTFTYLRPPARGTCCNPIAHWSDEDVWEFIHAENLPYCKLYDEGIKRTGCILCPMAGRRKRQYHLQKYPTICKKIHDQAEKYWNRRKRQGATSKAYTEFATAEEYWQWWLSDEPSPKRAEPCLGQLELWSNP